MAQSHSLQNHPDLPGGLRLYRKARPKTPILLVEGRADKILLEDLLSKEVYIVDAGTRKLVVQYCQALLNWNLDRFMCVFDHDFEEPEELQLGHLEQRCFPYEGRDLEMMLVSLGALEKVITRYGSPDKVQKLGGARTLANLIVESVRPVARLRQANADNHWGLPFDSVPLLKRLEFTDGRIQLKEGYADALLSHTDSGVRRDQLEQALREPLDSELGPNGKDVAAAAGFILHKLGSLDAASATTELITKNLHSCGAMPLKLSPWFKELERRLFQV